MKILYFDLETIIYAFTQDTSGRRKIHAEDTSIVAFGYQWEGDKKPTVIHSGQWPNKYKANPYNDKHILAEVAKVILKADVLIAHFGSGFDKPLLRTRLDLNGFRKAAQHLQKVKLIDTCIQARLIWKIRSSSLRYLAKLLNLTHKIDNPPRLWDRVIRSDPKAIQIMAKYCSGDVTTLRELYLRERAMMPNHPNFNFNKASACSTCTSENATKWGFRFVGKTRYQRYICNDCGSDYRGGKA